MSVLTDAERRKIIEDFTDEGSSMRDCMAVARAIEAAVLAKVQPVAKLTPHTFSPQVGKPGHCTLAQVWDVDGSSLATFDSTENPDVASWRALLLAEALNAAAQPQQAEPVAWRWKERINDEFDSGWRLTSFEPPTGPRTIAIEPLYNRPAQPRKRTEQDAWEDWAAKVGPSGDVDEVQRKWLASTEREEFMDEAAQPQPDKPKE